MSRRRGFVATMAQIQRQQVRQQAAYARAVNTAERQHLRTVTATERAQLAAVRQQTREYALARADEVDAMNAELAAHWHALDSLLDATLIVDDVIDLDRLKKETQLKNFDPGALANPARRPDWSKFAPPPPTGLGKFFAKATQQERLTSAQKQFAFAQKQHELGGADRKRCLEKTGTAFEKAQREEAAEVEAHNQDIDSFKSDMAAGQPEAIMAYFGMVLQESTYPEDFERSFRLAWVPDSRQLVVEYELPGVGVIPNVKAYRYVKARDEVTSTPRPQSQVKAQYASVVAQVSLRTIHELFEADTWGNVETVVLNVMVSGLDPRTGKTVRPCLVTVRTTRQQFAELDLAHVEPTACLKGLKASFSRSPAELTPVRPVLEFDMVDPRFVADVNVLDALDSRPNLMELSPTEFEGIISNLFSAMGLETKQTRPSRDGGVDCVAYDSRPILGGKVVIQAKRYRHTVGVSAVRDLFGTLQNEGASKGILVTTSGYGAASHEFANGKPIELIDGGGLLYLLQDHAGVQARIEPPDDWKDPTPDQPDQ
jgi:restriction system protein